MRPLLDERALKAAAQAFADQSTWGRGRNPEYVAMVERRMRPALAAYFAALDPDGSEAA
jgi:hypothetical protein